MGKINFNDFQAEKKYSAWGQYSMSKLANVLFTVELARRYKGLVFSFLKSINQYLNSIFLNTDKQITVVALHPGVIQSELWRYTDNQSGIINSLTRCFIRRFGKNSKQGAQSTIYCAINEDIPKKSGFYFK